MWDLRDTIKTITALWEFQKKKRNRKGKKVYLMQ